MAQPRGPLRTEVLTLLGVADPDDARARWWDGALAAVPPTVFPGVLTGLPAWELSANFALGAVALRDRDGRVLVPAPSRSCWAC